MTRLEAVQTIAQLDALDVDGWLAGVRDDLAPDPVVSLAALGDAGARVRKVLGDVDRFTERSMRIRIEAALTGDTAIDTTFRKTLAATVLQYERDLETLRDRVAMVASRAGGGRAAADAVVACAERVLADRARLRDGVADVARELARGYLPGARGLRDRAVDDDERAQWDAAVHDLEDMLGLDHTAREEPRELTRGELLELD